MLFSIGNLYQDILRNDKDVVLKLLHFLLLCFPNLLNFLVTGFEGSFGIHFYSFSLGKKSFIDVSYIQNKHQNLMLKKMILFHIIKLSMVHSAISRTFKIKCRDQGEGGLTGKQMFALGW